MEEGEHRFGGHQTFALRLSWLPKVAQAIERGVDPLTDPIVGVVELGLGKNMVEALRCWVEAYGVGQREGGAWTLTDEGVAVFGRRGHDRYLEDPQTPWWLHWRISKQPRSRLFAWELLVNRWNEPTFDVATVLAAFAKEGERTGRDLAPVTLKQHLDVFLRTYCSERRAKPVEDELDGPLASLGLVRRMGEREADGRREAAYAFDLGTKRSVSQALFRFCLVDWWNRRGGVEGTVPLAEVATAPGSPGRVLRMSAGEVRDRLVAATADPRREFELLESLNQQQLRRRARLPSAAVALDDAYDRVPA